MSIPRLAWLCCVQPPPRAQRVSVLALRIFIGANVEANAAPLAALLGLAGEARSTAPLLLVSLCRCLRYTRRNSMGARGAVLLPLLVYFRHVVPPKAERAMLKFAHSRGVWSARARMLSQASAVGLPLFTTTLV